MSIKFFKKIYSKSSANTLLILPFVIFLGSYFLAQYFFHRQEVPAPSVIGLSLVDAGRQLSAQRLAMRILEPRLDEQLPEGTVVEQMPAPGQKIKVSQPVFVSISCRAKPQEMPDLWGKKNAGLALLAAELGCDVDVVDLESSYPENWCIAQIPAAHQPLESKHVTVYCSRGASPLMVVPDMRGASIGTVEQTLKTHDVRADIFHNHFVEDGHNCSRCVIFDQQPSPGTIVNCSRGLSLQLHVAPQD